MSKKCKKCGDLVSNVHNCDGEIEMHTKQSMRYYSKETLIDKYYDCIVEKQELEQKVEGLEAYQELFDNLMCGVYHYEWKGEQKFAINSLEKDIKKLIEKEGAENE